MIQAKSKTIDGDKYTVTQMGARRALKMQAKLMKLVGPSLSLMLAQGGKTADEAEKCLPEVVLYLVNQLDEKTFDALVMELMQGIRKNDAEVTESTFDNEFGGELNTLFLVLQYVLEVNFGDFFSERGILKQLFATKEAEVPQA